MLHGNMASVVLSGKCLTNINNFVHIIHIYLHLCMCVCVYLMPLKSLPNSSIHYLYSPSPSKHSGMHLELQSKCFYLVSSPSVSRILLPPHTPCARLSVLVGVNQHISPSSSSHSVPTSSLLQCFCWVVLPPSRHLLE